MKAPEFDDVRDMFLYLDARRYLRGAIRTELALFNGGPPLPSTPLERAAKRVGALVAGALLALGVLQTALDYFDSVERTARARLEAETRLVDALAGASPEAAERLVCLMRRARFYDAKPCEGGLGR